MERMEDLLADFMKAIRKDPRVCLAHIGVFSVLLNIREEYEGAWTFPINREVIMEAAKISSTATYAKIIRQLHEYGYINYQPTFNKMKQSMVSIDLNNKL